MKALFGKSPLQEARAPAKTRLGSRPATRAKVTNMDSA
jgi:hypothetical protein